ncbi:hypothetical protein [Halomarina ordinaria]|uniref:Uncharacterized protein n=1 Tax=Halomarina ordinaria TaxID=3033939 RepID=A0ABD5UC36_9EURY|nr:hypothetical protein [Halomarina sp. PSRA2]
MYEHYRPTDTDHRAGTYRVVGTTSEAVTLLRVGDVDGQRVHTGALITVDAAEFDRFEPAENPDGNRPLRATITSALEMSYWSLRVLIRHLRSHPFAALVAVGCILLGSVGEYFFSLPDIVLGGLIVLGSLGLAYVGSGRL